MENCDFVAFVFWALLLLGGFFLNSEIFAKLNNLVDLGDVYQ